MSRQSSISRNSMGKSASQREQMAQVSKNSKMSSRVYDNSELFSSFQKDSAISKENKKKLEPLRYIVQGRDLSSRKWKDFYQAKGNSVITKRGSFCKRSTSADRHSGSLKGIKEQPKQRLQSERSTGLLGEGEKREGKSRRQEKEREWVSKAPAQRTRSFQQNDESFQAKRKKDGKKNVNFNEGLEDIKKKWAHSVRKPKDESGSEFKFLTENPFASLKEKKNSPKLAILQKEDTQVSEETKKLEEMVQELKFALKSGKKIFKRKK